MDAGSATNCATAGAAGGGGSTGAAGGGCGGGGEPRRGGGGGRTRSGLQRAARVALVRATLDGLPRGLRRKIPALHGGGDRRTRSRRLFALFDRRGRIAGLVFQHLSRRPYKRDHRETRGGQRDSAFRVPVRRGLRAWEGKFVGRLFDGSFARFR